MAAGDPLAIFHPLVGDWFRREIGAPTAVQEEAWPRIAAGEHVLATAPTGSGKTLAAFLWAIDRLLTGEWEAGRTRVLYVSPLRALNNDIRRNLLRPLEGLAATFSAARVAAPGIEVRTRSGDTPPAERRRMLRSPPEILITTPESLNILLTSRSGRQLLADLETVILDEIHAVASSKRGTHLITAVERLAQATGEFQRLALSATVRPLERMAAFVGGAALEPGGGEPRHRRRPVAVIEARSGKVYDLRVRYPAAPVGEGPPEEEHVWDALVADWTARIRRNRSTLFFANSRRLTEKVTRLLNEAAGEGLAYSHHGSLSREVRSLVEKRLKDGELKAIVATSSLELGIDIGALDEVVLIQSPRSLSATIQRVGRAGHSVGEVSRGMLYPTHGRDFIEAAVVARGVLEQEVETLRPVEEPLDVLAQVVLSMVATESRRIDELYGEIRCAYPYRRLSRRRFDGVLEMLAGRYADSRIRELRPRVSIDPVAGTVRGRPGVERILYMAGGTIADRGYFALRHEGTMAKLGELDEEFVWERAVGDSFTLGAQGWRVRRITHNDVVVSPARGASALAPFWRADARDRDAYLSAKVGRFLAELDVSLDDPDLTTTLGDRYRMEPEAAAELLRLLRRQKAATGVSLPHRHHLLVEHVAGTGGAIERHQVLVHTFWGGTVNRPFALAAAAALEERYGLHVEALHDDDCVVLTVPEPLAADELWPLVRTDRLETLLRRRLERTGFFGARFRLSAATALLLPRSGFRRRTPLWMSRARSKKLLEAVTPYGDFPILWETWRTCLRDEIDLETLRRRLEEVAGGEIAVSEVATERPSPFAANLVWRQTNRLMYADDTPEGGGGPGLRDDLVRELVFAAQLRPRLPPAMVEELRRKLQRTAPGYAPRPDELADWIEERLVVPEDEWSELLAAVTADHGLAAEPVREAVAERVAWVTLPGAERRSVVALAAWPRVLAGLGLVTAPPALAPLLDDDGVAAAVGVAASILLERWREGEKGASSSELVGEWLRYYGPLHRHRLTATFGLDPSTVSGILEELRSGQRLVVDRLTEGATSTELCDAENLETLLRWKRRRARPHLDPLGPEALQLLLATQHDLGTPGSDVEGLRQRLERLFAFPAPARLWETEILPARLSPYFPAWLDTLIHETALIWLGCGRRRTTFALSADLDLLFEGREDDGTDEAVGAGPAARLLALFPDRRAKYPLEEIAERAGVPVAQVAAELWELAWASRVTNDSAAALRKGVESRFRSAGGRRSAVRRARRRTPDRWGAPTSELGNWYVVELPEGAPDALDRDELAKERARLLLERYGVVFRALLDRELAPLRWSRVFRALRLMELSGEVLAGVFFSGVRGLQFASHAAFRRLQDRLPEDRVYWMNAADPASLCGVEVDGLKARLPRRSPTTHLVYHGRRLVLVARRSGKDLEVRVPADHPDLPRYFEPLRIALARAVLGRQAIDVEAINGAPAAESDYLKPLGATFRVTREPSGVKLWKRY